MKQRHEDGAETTETNTQLDTYTAGFVVFLFPVPVWIHADFLLQHNAVAQRIPKTGPSTRTPACAGNPVPRFHLHWRTSGVWGSFHLDWWRIFDWSLHSAAPDGRRRDLQWKNREHFWFFTSHTTSFHRWNTKTKKKQKTKKQLKTKIFLTANTQEIKGGRESYWSFDERVLHREGRTTDTTDSQSERWAVIWLQRRWKHQNHFLQNNLFLLTSEPTTSTRSVVPLWTVF